MSKNDEKIGKNTKFAFSSKFQEEKWKVLGKIRRKSEKIKDSQNFV
jgi:hypothetical protein